MRKEVMVKRTIITDEKQPRACGRMCLSLDFRDTYYYLQEGKPTKLKSSATCSALRSDFCRKAEKGETK